MAQDAKLESLAKVGCWQYRDGDRHVDWSPGTYRLHDVPVGEPITLDRALGFYSRGSRHTVRRAVFEALHKREKFSFEADIISARGALRRVRCFGLASGSEDRTLISGVVVDISEQHDKSIETQWASEHDTLTGLRNRRAFYRIVSRTLAKPGKSGWVALCDFDNMKPINDGFGHAVGDQALRHAANLMREIVPFAELCRIGGDEFAMFFPEPVSERIAMRFLRKLIRTLKRPMQCGSARVSIPCTIGLARWYSGDSFDEALRRADIALYNGKAAGKGNATLYTDTLPDPFGAKAAQVAVLAAAVAERRLFTAFQPIVSLADPDAVRVEALARTRSGKRVQRPEAFAAGLTDPDLSLQVLEQSIRDSAALAAMVGTHPVIHLNCTPANLLSEKFAPRLARQIEQRGLDPTRFVVEITENSSFFDPGSALYGALEDVRACGFRIALDDFGTGHSSLAHISRLPVNALKIDKSFVDDLHSEANVAVISALASISRSLELELIAEGLEDAATRTLLEAAGIELFQGYFLGRPTNFEELGRAGGDLAAA
nr:EAL domain-containing protein [Sphingomicrobium astaxanthinifaciens]